MSEKRKPYAVLLHKKQGKTNKVEMFLASQWGRYAFGRYRLRVNGVWFPKGETMFFTKTQVKEMFFKNI